MAQRDTTAAVLGPFVLDTVTTDTGFEWPRTLSPARSYSLEIRFETREEFPGTGTLLLATLVLRAVTVAVVAFRERDP